MKRRILKIIIAAQTVAIALIVLTLYNHHQNRLAIEKAIGEVVSRINSEGLPTTSEYSTSENSEILAITIDEQQNTDEIKQSQE